MASFTDSKDRTWTVRITPYTIRQAKDFAGINLGTILQDNMAPLQALLQDPVDVCSVLYAICQDEANAKGVDLRDFMEGIVGEPVEQACAALMEGLHEFFPTIAKAQLTALIALTKKQEKQSKKQVRQFLNDLTYLNSASRWQRLRMSILGIIRPRNWTS